MAPRPIVDAALVKLDALSRDPHPHLAGLRSAAPVAWVPALGAWLVTDRQLCVDVMRDPVRFTVDDPRFSTARVVGPSMLSLEGADHARQRGAFAEPFRLAALRSDFADRIATLAAGLLDHVASSGRVELMASVRRSRWNVVLLLPGQH